jgi:hypothetical protein
MKESYMPFIRKPRKYIDALLFPGIGGFHPTTHLHIPTVFTVAETDGLYSQQEPALDQASLTILLKYHSLSYTHNLSLSLNTKKVDPSSSQAWIGVSCTKQYVSLCTPRFLSSDRRDLQ